MGPSRMWRRPSPGRRWRSRKRRAAATAWSARPWALSRCPPMAHTPLWQRYYPLYYPIFIPAGLPQNMFLIPLDFQRQSIFISFILSSFPGCVGIIAKIFQFFPTSKPQDTRKGKCQATAPPDVNTRCQPVLAFPPGALLQRTIHSASFLLDGVGVFFCLL